MDIRPSALQMLKDIDHPYAEGRPVYDVTFENVQAGERTSHLFRLANLHSGLVVGTGDLSELALGWCTYGVGDHMSHYAVNASVPKTLIQHIIRWVALTNRLGAETSAVLRDILETPISPELVPASEEVGATPFQDTEAMLGPYELHDFYLYYTLRFGYPPSKIAFLAYMAWHDPTRGSWPDVPAALRNRYDIGEIKKHLRTFLHRFFKLSQYKRSAIPNAPKVGSGGSLSPRGDWRAPSDSDATAWLNELEIVPERSAPALIKGKRAGLVSRELSQRRRNSRPSDCQKITDGQPRAVAMTGAAAKPLPTRSQLTLVKRPFVTKDLPLRHLTVIFSSRNFSVLCFLAGVNDASLESDLGSSSSNSARVEPVR